MRSLPEGYHIVFVKSFGCNPHFAVPSHSAYLNLLLDYLLVEISGSHLPIQVIEEDIAVVTARLKGDKLLT
jgi:hypothetical protein